MFSCSVIAPLIVDALKRLMHADQTRVKMVFSSMKQNKLVNLKCDVGRPNHPLSTRYADMGFAHKMNGGDVSRSKGKYKIQTAFVHSFFRSDCDGDPIC